MEILLVLFLIPVLVALVIYALLAVGFVIFSVVLCTYLHFAMPKEKK